MKEIILPEPKIKGEVSLEETLLKRRSIRNFSDKELSKEIISQILWASYGISDKRSNFHTAPSAGAIFPIEIYAVISEGIFNYLPKEHKLILQKEGDLRKDLSKACYGQHFVEQASINVIIVGVYERITPHYGERGIQYTIQETGHIAQNIHLQAVALNLGSVPVGAFSEQEVSKVLSLKRGEKPLYVIPVGYPK